MHFGIICIIVGVIAGFGSLMMGVNTALQQVVQYLGYVCASLFVVGGLVIIQLYRFQQKMLGAMNKKSSQSVAAADVELIDKDIKMENKDGNVCKCGHPISIFAKSCPNCGVLYDQLYKE